MRIITVNLPISFIEEMETMIGNETLYPSRSEIIRVAVRDYLAKMITKAEQIRKEREARPKLIVEKTAEQELISIPVSSNSAAIYRTYKIIPTEKILKKETVAQEVSNEEEVEP